MLNVVIDTDVGGDVEDAFAISIAASSSKISVLAVTTVSGDTFFRANVATKLLEKMQLENIPVYAGLGDSSNNAPQHIVEMANNSVNKPTLICLGPLSNIAYALELDNNLSKKVKRLICMGGFVSKTYYKSIEVPLAFEHNFHSDVNALQKVLQAGFDLTILSANLTFTEKSRWTKLELKKMAQYDSGTVKFLLKMAEGWYKNMKKDIQNAGFHPSLATPWINDSFAVTYLICPNLFRKKETRISLEMQGKYPVLQSDKNGVPAKLIEYIDYKTAKTFIIKQLKKLP